MVRREVEEQEEARIARHRIAKRAESKKKKHAPRLTEKGGGEKRTSEFKPRGPPTKMISIAVNGATGTSQNLLIPRMRN